MDLRETLEKLEVLSEVRRVTEPVRIVYGIARSMMEFDGGPALLFENVDGFRNKVVAGMCATKKRLASVLGFAEGDVFDRITRSIGSPLPPDVRSDGPVAETQAEPKLSKLPILTHYEKDPAPYLTSAIVSAMSPDMRIENVSIHRMMVLDDRHLAIRIVPRHLYRPCERVGQGTCWVKNDRLGFEVPLCLGPPYLRKNLLLHPVRDRAVQFLVVFLSLMLDETEILHLVQIPPLHASRYLVSHQSVNIQPLEDPRQTGKSVDYLVGKSS